jgi:hypothetical protein
MTFSPFKKLVEVEVKAKVEGKKGFSSHRLVSIHPQPQP